MKGRVWKFKDNVDTDVIIPARYLNTSNERELAKHCMEDINQNFAKEVKKGDIIVAGENFGCGSSREHAPISIKASGIACVIAKSFARIFYRNSFNIGLPLFECKETDRIREKDIIEVDTNTGEIKDISTGETFHTLPLPPFMQELVRLGGLEGYAKKLLKEI
ncbi:MAG: 3-isopropylmalate dehydratase small subunit [Deltaproteobacteria bacterium]|nr:3-isopropylmalate dehydratase small subunit [Deltaproteobacteria bacterium]